MSTTKKYFKSDLLEHILLTKLICVFLNIERPVNESHFLMFLPLRYLRHFLSITLTKISIAYYLIWCMMLNIMRLSSSYVYIYIQTLIQTLIALTSVFYWFAFHVFIYYITLYVRVLHNFWTSITYLCHVTLSPWQSTDPETLNFLSKSSNWLSFRRFYLNAL